MKKILIVLVITAMATLVGANLWADDHLDDAYYWDGPTRRAAQKMEQTAPQKSRNTASTRVVTSPKQQPAQTVKTTQNVDKVSIISANDTVVKAVIRR